MRLESLKVKRGFGGGLKVPFLNALEANRPSEGEVGRGGYDCLFYMTEPL